jgi:hypothetical protein
MTDVEGRVERAIRRLPQADRERYADEWRHDLVAARGDRAREAEVARAASRMSTRLRSRNVERVLLGRFGAPRALGAWAVVVAVIGAALIFGGIVLLAAFAMLVALAVIFARAGAPSHWSHWLMVGSVVIGFASGAYFWWATGAVFDAEDAFRPAPPLAAWAGVGLIIFALCALTLLGSAVMASIREARLRR